MKNLKKIAVVLLAVIMVASVFTACDIKITQEQKIMGKWKDSSGAICFEFLDNNVCKATLDIIPGVGLFKGEIDNASYSVSKNDSGEKCLAVTFSLFGKPVTLNYTYTLEGNALTLKDTSNERLIVLFADNAG